MRKTRVLLISRPGIGGAAKHLSMLVKMIDKERFDVTAVVSSLEDGEYPRRLAEAKVQVVVVDMPREASPVLDLLAFVKILSLIRRERYEVVHTHTAKAGLLGRLAAAIMRTKVILHTPHGFYFNYDVPRASRFFHIYLEKFLGTFSKKVLLTSNAEARDVLERRIFRPGKVLAIPNAILLEEYEIAVDATGEKRALGIDPRQPVVGMVGRLSPPKDPATLVRAARDVVDEIGQVRFLLVGDGELYGEVGRLVEALNLSENVLLLGARKDAVRLISTFNVSVLSSLWEGLPFFLLESMALRKPVVATRVSGCCDVILHGRTGFLVDPQNPRELADKIIHILQDGELARQLGEAGRRHVEESFEATSWIKRIEEVYLS